MAHRTAHSAWFACFTTLVLSAGCSNAPKAQPDLTITVIGAPASGTGAGGSGGMATASSASTGAGTSSGAGTGSGGLGAGGSGIRGTASAGGASTGSGGGAGTGGSGGGPAPAWQTVLDKFDLDGVVLSLWGSGPNDVYAVGGPLGNSGYTSLIVHFNGTEWHRLQPGGTETYWWVGGSGPADLWMVGEEGRITHWNGSTFAEHASGTTATLWGVWAASPTDAWAVGGTPNGGTGALNDIVLHWNGATWMPEVLPGAPLGRSLFKAWGTSSNDLYVVGEKGTLWHREGTTWTLESEPPLTQSTLFTVHGCNAGEVYAVGGTHLLRSDGQSWMNVNVAFPNLVNGVACNAPAAILVVGFAGVKHRLLDGIWHDDFFEMPYSDLHAAWADGSGTFWAAGGDFTSNPTPGKRREGVIARFGKGVVASTISP